MRKKERKKKGLNTNLMKSQMCLSYKGLAVTTIHLAKILALECQMGLVNLAYSLTWDRWTDDGGVIFPSRKAYLNVSVALPPYFAESLGQ